MAGMTCPSCQAPLSGKELACPACRAELVLARSPEAPSRETLARLSKDVRHSTALVVVLYIIAAALVWFLFVVR
ncbi:MAG: hypothetical protein HY720_12025 [Planctomycetes bacterium]|nr:hypothetical protein [Planctomycetota bacterium]